MPLRRSAQAACLLALALVAGCSRKDRVNTDDHGLALGGYDPVSYRQADEPAKGSSEMSLRWSGATWHFASATNRSLFEADPERYAPQYGGYCSAAMADGEFRDADPTVCAMVDDKLYLFSSTEVLEAWKAGADHLIPRAEEQWADFLRRLKLSDD